MRLNRRDILSGVGGAALSTAIFGQLGWASDPPTPDQLPSREKYDSVTRTASSKPGEPPTPLPTLAHDIDDAADAPDVKKAHGVRRLKGKEWKAKSDQERDAYLRERKEFLPPNVRLVLTVPKGELWEIPEDKYQELKEQGKIHEWTDEQRASLKSDPTAQQTSQQTTIAPPDEQVASDAHDDIRGTNGDGERESRRGPP